VLCWWKRFTVITRTCAVITPTAGLVCPECCAVPPKECPGMRGFLVHVVIWQLWSQAAHSGMLSCSIKDDLDAMRRLSPVEASHPPSLLTHSLPPHGTAHSGCS
jgi:hypothetical protein